VGPTAVGIPREPIHLAVGALGEKVFQMGFGVGNRIRPCHPDNAEAQFTSLLDQRRLERCRIVQKSRLAYVLAAGTPLSTSVNSGRNEGRDFTRAYQFFAASSSFHGTSPR